MSLTENNNPVNNPVNNVLAVTAFTPDDKPAAKKEATTDELLNRSNSLSPELNLAEFEFAVKSAIKLANEKLNTAKKSVAKQFSHVNAALDNLKNSLNETVAELQVLKMRQAEMEEEMRMKSIKQNEIESRQKEMLEVLGASTGILEESNERVSKNEADIGEMLRGLALERETNARMQRKLLQKIEQLEDEIRSKVDVDEVADQVTKTLRFDLVLTKTKNVPVTNRVENGQKKVVSRRVTASSKRGKRDRTTKTAARGRGRVRGSRGRGSRGRGHGRYGPSSF